MRSRKTNPTSPAFFEKLESRQLFAAGGPTYSPPSTTPVTRAKLILQGTTARDNIAVDVKRGYLHWFLNGVTKRYNIARVGGIQIYGLNGNDTIKVGDGAPGVFIDGGGHNDTIVGGLQNDTIVGGVGNDKITGREGDDQIDGGKGRDDINAGVGQDKITAIDSEVDVVDGGDDFDSASLDLMDLFSQVERRSY
jgi:Ca2+-binding RTX toxin-like protein